ncbi:polymer-forming cytoskeletal protein, partial [Salmonella enterica subsp. enterica]|nr:polymer-forming cytoskeletal protein [Salmonella enterica subsp. enterica]
MRENNGRSSSRCIYILYLVYVTWLLSLGLFCLQRPEVGVFFFLTLVFLGLFVWSEIRSSMFNKKSCPQQDGRDCDSRRIAGDSSTTVIGEGTVMEGNILHGRHAEVYGSLIGDITLQDGTVRVMPGGTVTGTVRAA